MPCFSTSEMKSRGRVAGQGRLAEVWIGGDEIVSAGIEVSEIASSAAGDGDFLSDAFCVLEHDNTPAALSSFNRAKGDLLLRRRSPQHLCVSWAQFTNQSLTLELHQRASVPQITWVRSETTCVETCPNRSAHLRTALTDRIQGA